jgi:hypothetical protein
VARPIEPTSTPIAAPPVEPPPSEGADATPAWVVLGVGAAGAVAGGVLLGVAVSEHDAAVREPVSVRADEVDRGAIALRDAGVAVTVIGAAAAAAGLTWGLVASSSGPSSATHVAIGPQGVTVTGTF